MNMVAKATKKQNNYTVNKNSDKQLFVLYKKNKDVNLRNELVQKYLYIADILSKKFFNKGIEHEDIYQVAYLGLIYAVERYDVEKGFEFSSFATPTIIGEIKKYFRDKGWSIRIPRRIQELSKKVSMAKIHLQQEYQKSPRVIDIAEYLGCSEEEVLEAMESSQAYNPTSLDMQFDNDGDDKDVQVKDLIGEMDLNFNNMENKDFINKFMSKLDEIESRVVVDRFFRNKTQSVIAKDLNVSQMTVSRIEKKVIERLKKEYEKTL